MAHILDGVTVPMVTPLDATGEPDAAAAAPLIDALAAAGATTVMLLGTNGEGATVSPEAGARYAVEAAARWRSAVGDGARVLVAAFGSGTRETLARASALLDAEPDAIVVPPPHYFVHTERELIAHFAATAELGRPIVIYNTPRYSGNPITPGVLARAVQFEHVVGIKDSGGDDSLLLAAVSIAHDVPRFGVSQGNEKRLAWALRAGAVGITPGLANLAPAACERLVAAVRAGDAAAADREQSFLDAIAGVHSVRPGVTAMKTALNLLGLIPATAGAPFEPYSPDERNRLRGVLEPFAANLIVPLPAP